jgi:hypothetical protein
VAKQWQRTMLLMRFCESAKSDPWLRLVCLFFRPYSRMEQLIYQWMDFHEIWYYMIFLKPVEKIQILLKSERNKGIFYTNTCVNL